MARRGATNRHPALALKELQAKEQVSLDGIKETQLWEGLEPDQQVFLSFYLVYRDGVRAAKEARLPLGWIDKQERTNPDFKRIIESVLSHPRDFAHQMALEAAPLATHISINMMQDNSNKTAQLNAAKHIHALSGMIQSEAPTQGQFVNVNLQLPWEKKDDPKVVEGEVLE
jgi:hypothetical protein